MVAQVTRSLQLEFVHVNFFIYMPQIFPIWVMFMTLYHVRCALWVNCNDDQNDYIRQQCHDILFLCIEYS